MTAPIKILVTMGTRPEIIKLASVIHRATERSDFSVEVCHSGQHFDLAEPVLEYFKINPEYRLELMSQKPSLTQLMASCMGRLEQIFKNGSFDAVICQGDTATCAATSMAGFLCKVPVVHVEAGLRTGNLQSPWPEEFNRRVAGVAATLHCAATEIAVENLQNEKVPRDSIIRTGNTVIDALQWSLNKESLASAKDVDYRKLVLLTAHRRENFGQPLISICNAVKRLAADFQDHRFVFVTHPNPNAGPVVRKQLRAVTNVELHDPLDYQEFVRFAMQAKLIISDSGGVQEESPTLGVPLLITRDSTERPEAVQCGAARLVGTKEENVYSNAYQLLSDPKAHASMTNIENPFGDGRAADRILDGIAQLFSTPHESSVTV